MAAKQHVLVTGVNGYLGAHIVDQLVKTGYRVRGTVRSGKLDLARESNAMYGKDVEIVAADDLAFGDFTEALKGVDAVIHAAAPLFGRASPEEALTAAIDGAMNILRQTEKMGIKRFVLVSSLATVASPDDRTSLVWTDKDWIEVSREQALASKDPGIVYVTEKVLAERAVWEFADTHPHVDITTVNPPYFLGPYAPNFRFTDASLAQMSTNNLLYLLLDPAGTPPIPVPPRHRRPRRRARDRPRAHGSSNFGGRAQAPPVPPPLRRLAGGRGAHRTGTPRAARAPLAARTNGLPGPAAEDKPARQLARGRDSEVGRAE
ncbi:hypothetical protein ONZ51_g2814 [Trametes cubensis]|uniref:NAD-dependent epimerase/dehydratase domain-containing protein n=1 Tax=Trametes cubensis TaxID=1111947 RepID=A0AAD7XDL4_9APHY|nr:hypothetical protein ONZ51_g2814 [Trametes cubensis]